MKEFLNLNHISLMYISFLIMLSVTIISFGYCALGKKSLVCKYTILGNISYTLFFFIVSAAIGGRISNSHIIVAFLDLTAVIFWMMGLNSVTLTKQSLKVYIISSISNLILVSIFFTIFHKYSLIRSITSVFIVLVLINTLIRYYKNRTIEKLNTYKLTGFVLLLFSFFKLFMTVYRMVSAGYEDGIMRMSIFSSVNVLTLVSLIFAIWVNFSIVFLSYDSLNNDIKELSLHDHLTKLPNRRMIMNKLEELFNLYLRNKVYFAIVILDLDNFKKINDNYGHNIGDEVLEDFSDLLKDGIRNIDFAGRYGGEEFMLILQADKIKDIKIILDRIMFELSVKKLSSCEINISMSGGVVLLDGNTNFTDISKSISVADNRLYIAKENGKNQIVYEG